MKNAAIFLTTFFSFCVGIAAAMPGAYEQPATRGEVGAGQAPLPIFSPQDTGRMKFSPVTVTVNLLEASEDGASLLGGPGYEVRVRYRDAETDRIVTSPPLRFSGGHEIDLKSLASPTISVIYKLPGSSEEYVRDAKLTEADFKDKLAIVAIVVGRNR